MEENLTISVIIAERKYSLTIQKEDEEVIRKAAKMINEKLKEYGGSYAFRDKQDLLAMAALSHTTSLIQKESSVAYFNDDLLRDLSAIEQLLDEAV